MPLNHAAPIFVIQIRGACACDLGLRRLSLRLREAAPVCAFRFPFGFQRLSLTPPLADDLIQHSVNAGQPPSDLQPSRSADISDGCIWFVHMIILHSILVHGYKTAMFTKQQYLLQGSNIRLPDLKSDDGDVSVV